jgi:hypothetical protein
MTRKISLALVTVLTISPALAAGEPVLISAGEHEGYSRIAFEANGAKVTVNQNGRTVRLLNISPSASFDLKNINDYGKAYRIVNAKTVQTKNGKAIELSLNCDCAVRSMTLGNGKFVLDIADSTTQTAAPATVAQAAPPKASSKEEKSAQRAAARIGTPPSQDDILSVKQAHNQMVELLKQAAREGLITIKNEDGGAADAPRKTAKKTPDPAPAEVLKEPAHETPPVATAADDKLELPTPVTNASVSAPRSKICQPDGIFAINAADFEEEPLVEISALQASLADDGDPSRTDIVQKLVAGLLSIGFGEEALALLTDNDAQDSLRADIARIIAERDLAPGSALLAGENCSGAHALWQAAASNPEQTLDLFKRSGMAVETLPHRLRAMIATRLAMKLIAAEAWESAEMLYDIAIADVEQPDPDLKFVRARLDQHSENSDTAHDALLEIAESNSDASDDALLALADSYAKGESKPHEGFTEDIGALAKLGGSTHAMLAEADAWAKLGNVDAALFLLKGVSRKSDADLQSARKSAQAVFDDVFARGDTNTRTSALDAFLKHKEWFAPGQRAVETRIASAKASQEFGLPNLALFLMNEIENRDEPQFLKDKATAALTSGKMRDAIRIAAPYSADPDFGEIIVDANLRNGDYNAALASAATIADSSRKAAWTSRAAWLARSWKSSAAGFRALDPNLLNENAALKFALTAYKAREKSLPSAADAVLSQENTTLVEGLRSIFAEPPKGSALQRSRLSVERSSREIKMIQEILNDG